MNKKILTFALATVVSAMALLSGCGAEQKVITSADDLTGARIGVQLGTTGDIFATDVEDAAIERFQKGADAVMALTQGKIDCVIIDEQPAKKFVEVNEGLKILEEDFVKEEYAICLAKGNTELKDKINKALAELKADGTVDAIIANYIGDEAGNSPYVSPEGVEYKNGTLTVATNAEFEPYEYIEKGEIVGIDIDMMQAICDKLGMKLEVENIAFDSIIPEVTSGKADVGAAGMTVTEDRLQNVDFTDTYTTTTQVIIVKE